MTTHTTDATEKRPLSAFQYTLLSILDHYEPRPDENWAEPYGLGINHRVREYFGSEINHSRTYQNLGILVDDGLVDRTSLDDRTHAYALTADGAHELAARWTFLSTGDERPPGDVCVFETEANQTSD